MAIVLNDGDLFEGDATTASKVTYVISGLDGTTLKRLASGQLPNAKGTLYTASGVDTIAGITIFNTNSSAEVANLYVQDGTASRQILGIDSLGAGFHALFDGNKLSVYDENGSLQIETTAIAHASSHQNTGSDEVSVTGLSGLLADDQHVLDAEVQALFDDTAGGTDALVTKAPTSNVMYDHGVATTGVHGVGAGTVAKTADILLKNIIINGGFTINQRVYVSAAALAAGVYGHDRWKGGAGGGTYSFTQLASPMTITIAADKTLIQVVENKNVYGGTYILSWTGTCQARYAINSATPAGAYADSPITITGQTAGTTMSVEFGKGAASGTLGLVQLELGSVATPFEFRPYQQELALCQRYYWRNIPDPATSAYQYFGPGQCVATTVPLIIIFMPVPMRVTPTFTSSDIETTLQVAGGDGSSVALTALALQSLCSNNMVVRLDGATAAVLTVGNATSLDAKDAAATAWIAFAAEL